PLLITNFPIKNDHPDETQIQTEHLSKNQLISGLGHPTFSIISTYRIFKEQNELFPKAKKNLSELQSRYLGEYVVAHELGHALLGLPDYTVIENDLDTPPQLRSPASLGSDKPKSRVDYRECIMHSDFGGGFKAWEQLSSRRMDEKIASYCPEYMPTIEAF